jgi:hypothetical protein
MGYKVHVGERFEYQLTVQETNQFEYKNVKNALAITAKDKSCTYEVYDDCMYSKVVDIMKKSTESQCTVPWIRDNLDICSLPKDVNTTFWIAWNRITNQNKDCLEPCHETLVNMGAKNFMQLGHQNYSQLYFYFSSRATKTVEHYQYSFLILIGQIGGYLGLYRILLWILDLCQFNRLRQFSTFKYNKTKDKKKYNKKNTKGTRRTPENH